MAGSERGFRGKIQLATGGRLTFLRRWNGVAKETVLARRARRECVFATSLHQVPRLPGATVIGMPFDLYKPLLRPMFILKEGAGVAKNLRPILGKAFPIVGIGASAGGLEAFRLMLEKLPVNTGMGFVLVQHLDPTHQSQLTELLSRATKLPVIEARNQMVVRPNHIYVIPPNTSMAISGHTLRVTPRAPGRSHNLPIDAFLKSLAKQCGRRAVGVILSGTATDGAEGMKAIRAE